jgi:predicted TIM-barrel fold metal-dependent hydrolase
MAQIESSHASYVMKAMDDPGIGRMALFGRLHRKRSGAADVLALKRHYGGQIVVGTPKSFDQQRDLDEAFVQETLSRLDDPRFRFVGEIMFAHADKSHGDQTADGERYVAPEGKNVARLLGALEERRVPIMIHWEVYAWERDWPAFHSVFAQFPKLTFIWPHAGFASADQVRTVISTHGNVVVTLSKKTREPRGVASTEKRQELGGPMIDECGIVLPEWRALLEQFPDRFMFATDAHKTFRWSRYADIVKQWRLILGQLPEPLARAIAWDNAERVYGPAR